MTSKVSGSKATKRRTPQARPKKPSKAAGATRTRARTATTPAKEFSPRQVVVLGMHRSGTSALTGALARMGLFVGEADELTPSSWQNPEGFYERNDARRICDALLHGSGADWWKVSGFDPENADFDTIVTCRPAIRDMVKHLDDSGRSWAIKEPRLCLLLPIFRSALRRPFAVITARHPMEVARSLKRRNGFPIHVGLALWEVYTLNALQHGREVDNHILTYEQLLEDPEACLSALAASMIRAGADPDQLDIAAAIGAIDPQLRREHVRGPRSWDMVPSEHRTLYEAIRSGSLPDTVPPVREETLVVLKDFEQLESDRIDAKRKLRASAKALEDQKARSASLQQTLDQQARTASDLQTSLAALQSELGTYRDQKQVFDKALAEGNARLRQVEDALGSKDAALDSARSELQESLSRLESAEAALALAHRERDEHNERARTLEAEAAGLRATVVERAEELVALRKEKSELEAELSRLAGQLAELTDTIADQAGQIGQITDARDRLSDQLQTVAAERARLEVERDEAKREVEQVRTELAAQIEALSRTVSDAQAKENVLWDALLERNSALDSAEAARATLQAERQADASRIEELSQALNTSHAALKTAQEARTRLEAENVDLLQRMQSAPVAEAQHASELRGALVDAQIKEKSLWDALLEKTKALDAETARFARTGQELAVLRRELAEAKEGSAAAHMARASADQARKEAEALRAALQAVQSSRVMALARFVSGLRARLSGRGASLELATRREAIARSGLFDADWYLAQNPDVAENGIDPLTHYLSSGDAEGRDPHPLFRRSCYLAALGVDEIPGKLTALEHYLQAPARALSPHPLFDAAFYIGQLDGSRPAQAELVHYLTEGWRQGLKPNRVFDPAWYLKTYRDVEAAGIEPLSHYAASGARELRDPGPGFSSRIYWRMHGNVIQTEYDVLEHYLRNEGR